MENPYTMRLILSSEKNFPKNEFSLLTLSTIHVLLPPSPEMTMTATITETDLLAARARLTKLKHKQEELREQELAIRNYLADALFPEEDGSTTIKLGDTKVTVKRNLTYSITGDNAERLYRENGPLAEELLSWKPTVKVSGFKKNVETAAEYVVVKAGPPSVEFKD